jgi:hypothetical protein
VEFEEKNLPLLADFFVGKRGTIPVESIEWVDTRFNLPLSLGKEGKGVLSGSPTPSLGRTELSVLDEGGRILASAECETRHARSVMPNLPEEHDLMALVRPHLQVTISPSKGRFNLSVDMPDLAVARKLDEFGPSAEVAAAMVGNENEDLRIELKSGGGTAVEFILGTPREAPRIQRAYIQAIADGAWLARRAGLPPNLEIVPERLVRQYQTLAFLRSALSGKPVDWSGATDLDLALDEGPCGTVTTSIVEFADRVYVAAISCVGEAQVQEKEDGCTIAVKGARCALEEQATMSKSAFELRRSELLATWKASAEGWLKARGAVNTFTLEEPTG